MLEFATPSPFGISATALVILVILSPQCRLAANTSYSFGLRDLDKYLKNLFFFGGILLFIKGIFKRTIYS